MTAGALRLRLLWVTIWAVQKGGKPMSFKRVSALLLATILSCVRSALPQVEARWTKLRIDGVAAYGRGDYEQAEKALLASKQEAEAGGAKAEELATQHRRLNY